MKMLRVGFRRRREGKTDYQARIALLKSLKPRIIIRKTNKYIIAQIVKSKEAYDFTIAYANSKELGQKGWQGCFKNLAAAYLTGMLIANKAKKQGIDNVIVDFGLGRSTAGSRIYAVIKGAIDNGLTISCDPKMLPSEERLKKFGGIFNEIKEKIKGKNG